MPNKIKPKRSYTTNSVPLTTDLEAHELAINWADGVAYTKNASGQIVSVPLGGSGGSSSSEDTALRAYFLPTAPTNVTATAGNGQASVTWAASTTIAQIPVTDYVIQYSSNSGSTWTTFSDGTSTSTSATVTGLTNGTAYTFRVAGVNGVGTGAYSTASSAVTPVAAPSFVPIPIMTSATSPSGTASESGNLTGSSFAWKAMDKATASGDTTFYAAPSPSTNAWAQYDYGYTVSIGGYSLTSRQLSPFGRTQAPSQWTFSGSTDGTTFTTIETRSIAESSWAEAGETKTFMLASPATYRAFRWTWNSTPSAGAVVLPKVQMLAPAT